jgi:hypothetical protein
VKSAEGYKVSAVVLLQVRKIATIESHGWIFA